MPERRHATRDVYRDYWRENLEGWAGLYGPEAPDAHLENLRGPRLLRLAYQRTMTPIERDLLRERLRLCMGFVDQYVSPELRVNDVGCGTGALTTELLRRGATVVAIDFLDEALAATRARVDALVPERAAHVSYQLLDIRDQQVPPAHVNVAIGVAPYVVDLRAFFSNVVNMATTNYCHFLDADHWANRIRRAIPLLNVRRLNYATPARIDELYRSFGFVRLQRDRLGSGFLDVSRRS